MTVFLLAVGIAITFAIFHINRREFGVKFEFFKEDYLKECRDPYFRRALASRLWKLRKSRPAYLVRAEVMQEHLVNRTRRHVENHDQATLFSNHYDVGARQLQNCSLDFEAFQKSFGKEFKAFFELSAPAKNRPYRGSVVCDIMERRSGRWF